jgi:hypothetical protein
VRRTGAVALTAALLCLFIAATASAANSVYWVNYGANKISRANLGEGGGADLPISAANVNGPYGLAIDSAAGKIYWLNKVALSGSIGYANLDGSGSGLLNTAGAPFDNSAGLAIDPAAGKVYWGNPSNGTIGFANLNGSGGGQLNLAGATAEPNGLAIDPEKGRIYWTSFSADKVSYANLNGSGGGDLDTTGAPIDGPEGVAIDPTSNRIFWTNWEGNSIGFASLGGGAGGQFDTGVVLFKPVGLAIDPYSSSLYWANEGTNTIGYRNLGGAFGGQVETGAATVNQVAFPVLLVVPHMQKFPLVQGGHRPGVVLSCSNGEWMEDRLPSFLFQAPQSFAYQWLRNGKPIAGATQSGITADKVGKYNCEVTAANGAGADTEASNTIAISASIKLAKTTPHNNGTATVQVKLTGSGPLVLTGRGIARQRKAKAKGTAYLTVRATGKAKKTLSAKGKVKVKARIAYTPAGGKALRKTKAIVLKKGLR